MVPQQAEARFEPLCAELRPDARAIRRLQRRMERQRRAANPEHYDERGRPKKRKSLHGQLAHQIVAVGKTILTEKLSYKGWQKRYGKSVGLCAPGMLIDRLRRTGAAHGRHPA